MIVLKRYEDAKRDGDKIYANIIGIGLSNDGSGKNFLKPNSKGQLLCFERAYENTDISIEDIDYIECHMTGTKVGDITEIESIEKYFGKNNRIPKLGSVKSNLGHLLTAAGMSSLIKIIMSMQNEIIPATIKVEEPVSTSLHIFSSKDLVSTNIPWPANGKIKSAGINCFGFGGNNAHMIIQEDIKKPDKLTINKKVKKNTSVHLAIVGMDAHFGKYKNLEEINRAIDNGDQCFGKLPEQRWKGYDKDTELLKKFGFNTGEPPQGAYIDTFEFNFFKHKISALLDEYPIPEQLLIIKTADNALKESCIKKGENVAVIIAMELLLDIHQLNMRYAMELKIEKSIKKNPSLNSREKVNKLKTIIKNSVYPGITVSKIISYMGNGLANRVSNLWDFSGPSFAISEGVNSVYRALELAQMMLENEEVDSVLIGAVDLAGCIENVLLRNKVNPINNKTKTLCFGKHSNGWLIGEGAGVIVVKNYKKAKESNNKIYALIDSINITQKDDENKANNDYSGNTKNLIRSCTGALKQAGVSINDIGYLEANASGIQKEDEVEINGLIELFKKNSHNNKCAIGSIKTNLGHTYTASGLASVIKAALCLFNKYIPSTPHWNGPKENYQLNASTFYVPEKTLQWNLQDGQKRRIAVINGLTNDNTFSHIILSEVAGNNSKSSNTIIKKEKNKRLLKKVTVGMRNVLDAILSKENINIFKTTYGYQNLQNDKPVLNKKNNNDILVKRNLNNSLYSSYEYENNNRLKALHLKYLQVQHQKALNFTLLLKNKEIEKPLNIDLSYNKNVIYEESDLIEFAIGKVSNVFGKKYEQIDLYKRRVRLPVPPYFFISRVTGLNAKFKCFKPCSIETEYDIPDNAWYVQNNGQIPASILYESAQGILVLISYCGVDLKFKGKKVYRALSGKITHFDRYPEAGDTIKHKIRITKFINNDNMFIFYIKNECYVHNKINYEVDSIAGLFSDDDLKSGKSLTVPKIREKYIKKKYFKPLLSCKKNRFSKEDLLSLCNGDFVSCFNESYYEKNLNTSLFFVKPPMLMIDRIIKIDPDGGTCGLGLIISEKDLHKNDWYFRVHFKNDYCMPGVIVGEGGIQTMFFYLFYLGLYKKSPNSRLIPIVNRTFETKNSRQVLPTNSKLTYRLEITDISIEPVIYIIGDVQVIFEDKIIVLTTGFGFQFSEER